MAVTQNYLQGPLLFWNSQSPLLPSEKDAETGIMGSFTIVAQPETISPDNSAIEEISLVFKSTSCRFGFCYI